MGVVPVPALCRFFDLFEEAEKGRGGLEELDIRFGGRTALEVAVGKSGGQARGGPRVKGFTFAATGTT